MAEQETPSLAEEIAAVRRAADKIFVADDCDVGDADILCRIADRLERMEKLEAVATAARDFVNWNGNRDTALIALEDAITECDAHVREAHPKPPEMTADEAIAIVDGWGPEQQFGLHRIARTLRQHASLMEGNRDIWANEANALAAVVVKTTRERDEARAEVERLRRDALPDYPVQPLRQALSYAGIAAPESDEALAFSWAEHAQMVIRWAEAKFEATRSNSTQSPPIAEGAQPSAEPHVIEISFAERAEGR